MIVSICEKVQCEGVDTKVYLSVLYVISHPPMGGQEIEVVDQTALLSNPA